MNKLFKINGVIWISKNQIIKQELIMTHYNNFYIDHFDFKNVGLRCLGTYQCLGSIKN
jgi:hypothetical protein